MKKTFFWGAAGSIGLTLVYFGIVSWAQSFQHALDEFVELYYLLLPLVVGFGVQVALYVHVKQTLKHAVATPAVAAAGGISTTSMIACCAHHLTDILPLLGLTVAATFLAGYQTFFIVLGLLSNVVGITIMLRVIQKNNLQSKSAILHVLSRYDFAQVQKAVIIASVVIAVAVLVLSLPNREQLFAPIIQEADGVTFNVVPRVSGSEILFDIVMDTHQGSLDIDLTKAVVLRDKNSTSQPIGWSGDPPGGHHRKGVLTFSKPDGSFELLLNIGGRTVSFKWN